MKNEDRSCGLYWIVLNGTWGIAEWLGSEEGWNFNGYKVGGDDFFEKIYDKVVKL